MSLFPVRCFTCGKVLKWEPYEKNLTKGETPDKSLDALGYKRMCCRRMFFGYCPELEKDLMRYNRMKVYTLEKDEEDEPSTSEPKRQRQR
jgi:DNA-directed RNA polymerase subunit N (RpoN/RPB10)